MTRTTFRTGDEFKLGPDALLPTALRPQQVKAEAAAKKELKKQQGRIRDRERRRAQRLAELGARASEKNHEDYAMPTQPLQLPTKSRVRTEQQRIRDRDQKRVKREAERTARLRAAELHRDQPMDPWEAFRPRPPQEFHTKATLPLRPPTQSVAKAEQALIRERERNRARHAERRARIRESQMKQTPGGDQRARIQESQQKSARPEGKHARVREKCQSRQPGPDQLVLGRDKVQRVNDQETQKRPDQDLDFLLARLKGMPLPSDPA